MKPGRNISNAALLLLLFLAKNDIAEARSLEEIKKTDEIRLCLAGSGYQYYKKMGMVFAEWLDVNAVVRRLDSWDQQFYNNDGVTIKAAAYTPYLLESGECDFYPNDLVVTDWRKKKLAFVVLYQSRMVVLVHNDEQSRFTTENDLKGKTAAIMKNTTYHSWLKEQNRTVFTDNPVKIRCMKSSAARKLVHEKMADFTITNLNIAFTTIKEEQLHLKVAFPVGPVTEVGWAFRQEDHDLQKAAHELFNRQRTKNSQFDDIWKERGVSLSDYMLFLSNVLSD